MAMFIQPSFARGEIGADLFGRVDIAAYRVSLRTALNVVIHSYGGVSNRAGTKYVGPCKTHTGTPPRIYEFKFNTQDTYILEFGDEYMRVVRNDAHVLNAAQNITAITAADPAVVTITGHGFSNGQDIYVTGVAGMTQLNNRWFSVANVTTDTFELTSQQTKADIDASGYDAYVSGGTASTPYEITTPYDIEDTLLLKFVQSANVMTIVHPSYAPRKLSRADHDDWTLEVIAFAPAQDHPTNLAVTSSGSGTTYRYQVTAINAETQEESLPATQNDNKAITAITKANPAVVTSTSHGFANGDEIEINNVVGMTELNGRRFELQNVATNTYELVGEDSTGYGTYVSGGRGDRTFVVDDAGTTPEGTITWAAEASAGKYSVYRDDNGLFGWIGDTEELSFTDDNIEADLSLTPPKGRNPFFGGNNYPGTVSYYEQRRVFGNSNNQPDTSWYSVTGSQDNMSQSSPRQPDDAITATLNSLEVNEIRAFVPMNDLLIFTSGSEWRVNSGSEAAFSAENLRQKPQSNWGSAHLRPIVVGDKVLFVTENESVVRSIGYEIQIDGYKGNDMTIFAPHLFRHSRAKDWAFAGHPDPLIHVVRADGVAPCLTFNPEQEVTAWSRWETEGKFLRVAATRPNPTSVERVPYFVVQRKVGGQSAYYIERIASRIFQDVRDCFFVDSGLSLDVPVTITGATSADPVVVTAASHGFSDGDEVDISDIVWEPNYDTVRNKTQPDQLNDRRYYVAEQTTNTFQLVKQSGRKDITGATQTDPVVITSASHGFSNGDVIGIFNVLGMTELNGKTFKVANATADTFELNTLAGADVDGTGYTAHTLGGTIYPAEDGTSFNAYDEGGKARKAVLTVGNLWHLEGKTVVALADGNVVTGLTVTNGEITFDRKCSRAHIGLRYVSDIETLDIEVSSSETLQGRNKRVPTLTMRMKDSRGLLGGPNSSSLKEMKQREFERMGQPTQLLTGDKEMHIPSDWKGGGRVFIRQIYPLPLTITALIPDLDVGDDM